MGLTCQACRLYFGKYSGGFHGSNQRCWATAWGTRVGGNCGFGVPVQVWARMDFEGTGAPPRVSEVQERELGQGKTVGEESGGRDGGAGRRVLTVFSNLSSSRRGISYSVLRVCLGHSLRPPLCLTKIPPLLPPMAGRLKASNSSPFPLSHCPARSLTGSHRSRALSLKLSQRNSGGRIRPKSMVEKSPWFQTSPESLGAKRQSWTLTIPQQGFHL